MSAFDTAGLQLDNQLCFKLYAASRAVIRAYKPMLDALGLTYPQYLAMLVLWERDGQMVSELGERLSLDSGTLTPLLKRMEAAGWLQRQRSTTDERRVQVCLSADGLALKTRAACVPAHMAQALACDLPELRRLTTELHTLRKRLQAGECATGTAARTSTPDAQA